MHSAFRVSKQPVLRQRRSTFESIQGEELESPIVLDGICHRHARLVGFLLFAVRFLHHGAEKQTRSYASLR